MNLRMLLATVSGILALAACGAGGGGAGTDPATGSDDGAADLGDQGKDSFVPADADYPDPGSDAPAVDTYDAFDAGKADFVEDAGADAGDWASSYGLPCPLTEKIGEFRVNIDNNITGSWIQGHVSNQVEVQAIFEEGDVVGGCMVKRPVQPFCDPPCQAGKVCTQDYECIDEPERLDVGTVTFTGLSEPVSLVPDWNSGYSKNEFAADAYTVGAQIEMTATGKDVEGFSMQGGGVARIEVPFTELSMAADKPLDFTWTPANGPGVVFIEIDMTQHGITPVNLYCEVEDTGSLTVPASLMSQVVGSWMQGIPEANIRRRTVDSVDLSLGCVEFEVFHEVRVPMSIQ